MAEKDRTQFGPPPEHPGAAYFADGHDNGLAAPRVCKNCKFYGVLDVMTAICRFDPPRLLPIRARADGQPGWESVVAWPDINPETDWCSRFVAVRNWTRKQEQPALAPAGILVKS